MLDFSKVTESESSFDNLWYFLRFLKLRTLENPCRKNLMKLEFLSIFAQPSWLIECRQSMTTYKAMRGRQIFNELKILAWILEKIFPPLSLLSTVLCNCNPVTFLSLDVSWIITQFDGWGWYGTKLMLYDISFLFYNDCIFLRPYVLVYGEE